MFLIADPRLLTNAPSQVGTRLRGTSTLQALVCSGLEPGALEREEVPSKMNFHARRGSARRLPIHRGVKKAERYKCLCAKGKALRARGSYSCPVMSLMISDRPLGRRPFCSLWATVVLPLSFFGQRNWSRQRQLSDGTNISAACCYGPRRINEAGSPADGGSFFTAETEKWGNVVNPLVSNQSEPQLGLFP